MIHDLLYLSENKMRALVPQLPGQLRRRLGFEAGLNAGIVSAKATLQGESESWSVALLDAVVEMIEREKGPDSGPTANCAPACRAARTTPAVVPYRAAVSASSAADGAWPVAANGRSTC